MIGLRRFAVRDGFAFLLMVAGTFAAALAVLVLFVEAFEWLTRSEWPGLTLADGLALFGIAHELPENETQRLNDVLLAVPLTIALFLTGTFMFLAGAGVGDRRSDARLKREMQGRSPAEGLTLLLSREVSAAQFVRLVLLDDVLAALLWFGAGLAVGGWALYRATGELWLTAAGAALVVAGAAFRIALRRR